MQWERTPRVSPPWLQKYLHCRWVKGGRSAEEADCWGYLRLLMLEQGVELPPAPCEVAALRAAVDIQRSWPEVQLGNEQLGDVVLFRNKVHVGMVVTRGWMTHIDQGLTPTVECFMSPLWRPRIEAIYRHT